MDEKTAKVRDLLHEVAETHHVVYRITDGTDDDWATFYADWLTRLSELPSLLGVPPLRSALTAELVSLDREYRSEPRDQAWEEYYAKHLVERMGKWG